MRVTAYDDYKDRIYRDTSEKAIKRLANYRERLYVRVAGYLARVTEGLLDDVSQLSAFNMADEIGGWSNSYSSIKFLNLVIQPLIKAAETLEKINPANSSGSNPNADPLIANAVRVVKQGLGLSYTMYDKDIRTSLKGISASVDDSKPGEPGGSD